MSMHVIYIHMHIAYSTQLAANSIIDLSMASVSKLSVVDSTVIPR